MNNLIFHPVYWVLVGVVLILTLFASKAFGALNYRDTSPSGQAAGLRLSEAPCTQEAVVKNIKAEFLVRFKAAVLTWNGRDWHSCYTEVEMTNQDGQKQTFIFSIDEEGVIFNAPYGVPKKLFREDSI